MWYKQNILKDDEIYKKIKKQFQYITFIPGVRGLLVFNFMPLGVQKPLIWTFIIQMHFVPVLSLRLMNWQS